MINFLQRNKKEKNKQKKEILPRFSNKQVRVVNKLNICRKTQGVALEYGVVYTKA